MAKVITVKNYKGGVGKTTISTHLAAGLAASGYRVGIVDTDAQAHTSIMLNMPEENGLYSLLIDRVPFDEVVRTVPVDHYAVPDRYNNGELFLVPSSSRTYRIPDLIKDVSDGIFAFVEMTDAFGREYDLDYVIIDTNPSMSDADTILNMATDYYLYVTECTRLSYDGLRKAIRSFEIFSEQRQKYMHRPSSVLGIVPNKMQQQTKLHRRNIESLGRHYSTDFVWSPIIAGIVWQEAADAKELVYTWHPTGQEAHLAWEMVARVVKAVEHA